MSRLSVYHCGQTVSLIKAYFDESGSHAGSRALCVAGFIIESHQVRRMETRWQEMLARYQLPYFHMVDCAHGLPPFQALDKSTRIAAETEAIDIICDTMAYGIAVSLDPKEYDEYVAQLPLMGSAYTLCAHTCLAAVKAWCNQQNYHGKIDFYFESGHASEAECDILMKRLFAMPHLKRDHRHETHSFCDKRMVTPLQAADIIAWLYHTEQKRGIERKRPRPRLEFQGLNRSDGKRCNVPLHEFPL